MNQVIAFLRDRHSLIFKVFLFVVAVSAIVFIFPREGKFKYEFQKGKPWPHEDLIAPFNYPIYKSQAELEAERERIEAKEKPYFFRNQAVEEKAISQYQNRFEEKWGAFRPSYNGNANKESLKQFGHQLIEDLYEKGIIELHESIEGKPEKFEVQVLKDNVAVLRLLGNMHNIQSAYAALKDSLNRLEGPVQVFMLNTMEDCLRRNISYDKETNELMHKQALSQISPTQGMVQKGERVIAKGELINDAKFQLVESLKKEYEAQLGDDSQLSLILVGQVVLVAMLILSLALFLISYRPVIIRSDLKIVFLLLLIVLFVFGSKMAINIENINLYLVPFCMLPLLIRTFFDLRVALFTHLVTILIVGFIAPNPYEFIIIQMMAGMLTLFSILNLRNRSHLFLSSLVIFGVYSLVYLSIGLIQEGSFADTNWRFLGWFFGSAMLSLFTYPLVYIFEKVFGFVSDVTLLELADTNSKLLRKLNMKAPGTFQHSLQVSNLAEEAIRYIGGNALLMRTGALYHDIGKMNMPNYFIENQNSDYNPHEELDPEESAAIIIEHVIRGVEMARRYKLPDIVIDFIRTHHGTSRTQYFFHLYKEQNPEEEIDESKFRYPGPIPYSKETAVLMMADSVEAASRSLTKYDGQTIEKLVDGIIDLQIKEGQFENASITFKDINEIKKIFKKKLMSIYHVRVEYPE
ncbi:MAG: HDIG domain-containing protein [Vicingaceae bacterium]